uniref:Uncharacterized protein n=2 Tax=Rhizobium rhizogenes TaxID=359 RepID=A0A7S4ZUS8_RHIRH|nr:hypothetical protein pC5.8d_745 [Rhizobium rhizogenes]
MPDYPPCSAYAGFERQTTALHHASSGYVDWRLTAIFIAGRVAGSHLAEHRSARTGALNSLFATLVFVVAADVLYRSLGSALRA